MWEILSGSQFKTHFRHLHVLTTQSFIIRFSLHTGGNTWHSQKQTNKQTNKRVSIPPPPQKSVSESLALLSRACILAGLQHSTGAV